MSFSHMHVLLTGGSGFIASHVLDVLLARGYTVVATVRSEAKADLIRENHPDVGDQLKFVIVKDIAQPGAFDEAVKSKKPFDFVIHTASPFFFNTTDVKKDLLDPAVIGTTSLLRSIKKHACVVKRVVITSSLAAMLDENLPANHIYSEKDWNGITEEQAVANGHVGYRGAKTFAEKAAWEFVEKEQPNFDLVVLCPPMVFGPVHTNMQTLDGLNTSNQRVKEVITGGWKRNGDKLPFTNIFLYVDVRDVAIAHVNAIERGEAGSQRYFVCAGHYSNKMIADIIEREMPEYADRIPSDLREGDFPPKKKLHRFDNSLVKDALGVTFRPVTETIVDSAKSIVELFEA